MNIRYAHIALGILAFFTLCASTAQSGRSPGPRYTQESAQHLDAGQSVSGQLGGAGANYSFSANSDDYFELSVEKTGTDFSVSLSQPDGRVIRSVACSYIGPIRISELASKSGNYLAKINVCGNDGTEQPYRVIVSQPRAASRSDRLRITAEHLVVEAEKLVAEYKLESTREAISKYEEALGKWRAIRADVEEARTLNAIAELYRNLGDLERALSYTQNSLTVARSNKDSLGEAAAYLSLALIYLNQGSADKALETNLKALEIARNNLSQSLEAEIDYFSGTIYSESKNDYEKATQAFNAAQRIWHDLKNRLGEAKATLALAGIDFDLTRLDVGPKLAQRALTVFQSLQDRRNEALALIVLGHFQLRVGRKQMALNRYEEARPIVFGSGDLYMEATLLNAIARVHYDLGETRSALQFYETALLRNQELRDKIGIAYSLLLVGDDYFSIGNIAEALSYLNRALDAFRTLPNKRMEGVALGFIGQVYQVMGDVPKAMDSLNRSLELIRSASDRRVEAYTLTNIGHLYESMNETDRALQSYDQALELSRAIEDPFGEVSTLYQMAHALRTKGMFKESLERSEAAIKIIEGTRPTVASSGLRTSYFASVRQQYELYIDVLMRQSSTARAFEASEQSRARTLLDSIAETRLSISEGADAQQTERELTLKTLLDAKTEQYTQLLSAKATTKDIKDAGDEIRTLTAEYEELRGQIRAQSPRYAALVQPQPLRLEQIQKDLLDDNSLLLEYTLGDEKSYLWAVDRNEFAGFVLPKRSDIETKVSMLRDLMTSRVALPGEKPADLQTRLKTAEARYPQAAAEISQLLLGAVADRLRNRRLVIVADGVLQNLPFGALPAPQTAQTSSSNPLIVGHEIVNLPSASTLAVIRREAPLRGTADRTIAVFADPVFEATDPRVRKATAPSAAQPTPTRAAARSASVRNATLLLRGSDPIAAKLDLPRLTATRQEAEAIIAMVPEERRMAALGFNATKAAVMNPDLKRYRIVHFATHTILNNDYPDLSSLVLSLVDEKGSPQSGFLRLRDMYNLQLAAELVVLSACDTGLGKEVKGEGLMSMVRGFMYSGTPRVLASLWKIDDEATAELMTEFYKNLLQNNMTPAAALRQAQITQMQKKSRQSPYYWAGFQLQGEWN